MAQISKRVLDLLQKQPKSIKKKQEFIKLVDIYNSSTFLKKLPLNNRAFSLLNRGKVNQENLSLFYKTFKIEANIFFPVFVSIRNKYLTERKIKKLENEKYIYQKMILLPDSTKKILKYLNVIEKKVKIDKTKKIWSKFFYPTTRTKANKVIKYNNIDWGILFFQFIDELSKRYNIQIDNKTYKKVSLFILEINEDKTTYETIKKQYRILSMKYHPDKGGNSLHFNILKNAKDKLFERNKTEIKNGK